MRRKNECLKERKVDNPYEIWRTPDGLWQWNVLKKWQIDDDKPFARWFCAVRSPMTYDSFEYGDVYVKDIKNYATKVTPEMDLLTAEEQAIIKGLKKDGKI